MRKTISWVLGVVVAGSALAAMAAPASAKSKDHHRRRHHHHRVVPVSPGGGPGGSAPVSGITITPATVVLAPLTPPVASKGRFAMTFTMSGLPALTTFSVA